MTIQRCISFSFGKKSICFQLGLFLIGSVAWAQTAVSLTVDALPTTTTAASVTLSGSVAPVDAALTLNAQAVTLAGDGTFSTVVTLNDGVNTLLLRAEKAGLDPAVTKLDLYRDLV